MKLYTTLETVLKTEPNYVTDDGNLKKWVVINKAQNYDADLLTLLLENEELKKRYFKPVAGALVFDQNGFINFLEQKNYLNDSYTAYKNKVGLNIDGKYLKQRNEVSLVWPFKDCVLEGGQSREEDKREEIFFNETLAQDEITQLLEPKVLTNAKRYTINGIEFPSTGGVPEGRGGLFNRNENGTITDNLIIKGNNLLALHTLKEEFAGKVKLIYIDPPYNTGNDGFKYNDSFNHSTWLTFMRNRLTAAKQLLREDGVIFVQCDDNEQAYLKVLMDEVFDKDNFMNLITVKTKIGGVSGSSEGKSLKDVTEFIICFSKDKNRLLLNDVFEKTPIIEYVKSYISTGKSWKYTQIIEDFGEKIEISFNDEYKYFHYPFAKTTSINLFAKKMGIKEEDVYSNYYQKIYRTTNAQSSIRGSIIKNLEKINTGIVSIEYKPIKGKNQGLITEVFYNGSNKDMFMFLKDMLIEEKNQLFYKEKLNTLWQDIQYNNLSKEGDLDFKNGKKPEKILLNLLKLATNESDIVLDFHLGSGTTAAVAHKMNRQFIGIEQMDYIETVAVERLKKVIEGEQGGISKAVNWQGGGEFVYLELKKHNQTFIEQIETANDTKAVLEIWEQMKAKSFLNYNVDLQKQEQHIEDFKALTLAEQKQHLVELLDKNQLYVNLSSLHDNDFEVSVEEKKVTQDFYQIKNKG